MSFDHHSRICLHDVSYELICYDGSGFLLLLEPTRTLYHGYYHRFRRRHGCLSKLGYLLFTTNRRKPSYIDTWTLRKPSCCDLDCQLLQQYIKDRGDNAREAHHKDIPTPIQMVMIILLAELLGLK